MSGWRSKVDARSPSTVEWAAWCRPRTRWSARSKALSGKVERTREREREQQKRHSGRLEGQTGGHHRTAEAAHLERTADAELDVRVGTRDGGER